MFGRARSSQSSSNSGAMTTARGLTLWRPPLSAQVTTINQHTLILRDDDPGPSVPAPLTDSMLQRIANFTGHTPFSSPIDPNPSSSYLSALQEEKERVNRERDRREREERIQQESSWVSPFPGLTFFTGHDAYSSETGEDLSEDSNPHVQFMLPYFIPNS